MRHSVSSWKFWTAIGFVGMAGGVAFFCGSSVSSKSMNHAASSQAQSSLTAATRGLAALPVSKSDQSGVRFHPLKNQRYVYSFERKIVLKGLGNQAPEIAYHGKLYLDVIRSDANGFEALVRDKVVEQRDPSRVSLKIQSDPTGRKIVLSMDPAQNRISQQDLGVLKDLIANWDFFLRADTVGSYDARFETLQPEAGMRRFSKSKLAYLSPSGLAPVITYSRHLLRWDPSLGMPREVRGSENTRMSQGKWKITSDSSYALKFERIGTIPDPGQLRLASMSQEEPLALSRKANTRAMVQESAKGLSRAHVLSELQDLATLSPGGRLKVFGDMLKLLRSGAMSVDDAQGLIMSSDILSQGSDSPLFKTVIGALASYGSPQAQAAMVQVYKDPSCPTSGKGEILAAFTTTPAVLDPDTRGFLENEMDESDPDLSQGAAFALGASLQKAPDDSQSESALAKVQQLWNDSAGSPNESLVLLDVMGNSGRSEYLPEIASVIQSPDGSPDLRPKAVFALRFMNNEQAASLLAASLADPNVRVRLAAVEAMKLAKWNEAFRAPLQSCSSSESVNAIQSSCRALLSEEGGNS